MGTSLGLGYTTATAVATVVTTAVVVSFAMYAGDQVYNAVTGQSPMLDTVFQGNQNAYDTGLMLTTMGAGVLGELATISPGACFVAGTMVMSEMGNKPIEEIQPGEYVWASNPETGEVALKRVVQTFVNESEELVHIQVNGEEIVCTREHPFYSPVKGMDGSLRFKSRRYPGDSSWRICNRRTGTA